MLQRILDRYQLSLSFVLMTVLTVIYVAVLIFLNEGVLDEGDGVSHYTISRYSWQHPELLVNHWGKPLFTLLSSPFAQFGIKGIAVFNLILFFVSTLCLYRIVQRFNLPHAWLIPILLVASPEYLHNLLAGHTEILFGTLLLFVIVQMLKQHWALAVVLCSLLPFSRSEGMLPVLVLGGVLVLQRQWKFIPLLLSGFTVYAVAGELLTGQFLWYFTQDPYGGFKSVYGSGPWYHFLSNAPAIFSFSGVLLLVIGGFYFTDRLLKRNWPYRDILLFGGIVFIGVFAAHSVLWAKGLKGSLGLLRVMVGIVPLAVPVMLYGLNKVNLESRLIRITSLGVLLIFGITEPYRQYQLPKKPIVLEELMREAGLWTKQIKQSGKMNPKIISTHNNLIALYAGIDPHDMELHPNFWFIGPPFAKFGTDDLIVWETRFGSVEGGMSKDTIERYGFNLLRRIPVGNKDGNLKGEGYEVRVYTKHAIDADTVLVNQVEYKNQWLDTKVGSFVIMPKIPFTWLGNDMHHEYWIDVEVTAEASPDAQIKELNYVLASQNNRHYNSMIIPVSAEQARVTQYGRIYLPTPAMEQYPLVNNLWIQGTGKVFFPSVKLRLMKRMVTIL